MPRFTTRNVRRDVLLTMVEAEIELHCAFCGACVGSMMPVNIQHLSALVDAVMKSSGKTQFTVRLGAENIWHYVPDDPGDDQETEI